MNSITAEEITKGVEAIANEVPKEVALQGGINWTLLIAILSTIALIVVLFWKSKNRKNERKNISCVGDILKRFFEEIPEEMEDFKESYKKEESQESFLKFNNCLYQDMVYSEYDVTVLNPELEIADGRTMKFQQLENRERFFIGRGSMDNDIEIVNNIGISRKHVVVERVPGSGFRIRLREGTNNKIYLCNEHYQNPRQIQTYNFQGETIYVIIGDIRYGERIAIRHIGSKSDFCVNPADSKICNDMTKVENGGRFRWQA